MPVAHAVPKAAVTHVDCSRHQSIRTSGYNTFVYCTGVGAQGTHNGHHGVVVVEQVPDLGRVRSGWVSVEDLALPATAPHTNSQRP